MSSVRDDYEKAEASVDDYVEEQEEQNETEKAVAKEPDTLPKTNEDGDIEFDVNAIERTAEGKPSVVAAEEGEPSSFTEPIDFSTEENDKKDEQGVSGQVGEGEKPVETEPVAEPSKETPSPSGVVQEEQEVSQKEIDDYKSSLTRKIEYAEKQAKFEIYNSLLSEYKTDLKELNEDPNTFFAKKE